MLRAAPTPARRRANAPSHPQDELLQMAFASRSSGSPPVHAFALPGTGHAASAAGMLGYDALPHAYPPYDLPPSVKSYYDDLTPNLVTEDSFALSPYSLPPSGSSGMGYHTYHPQEWHPSADAIYGQSNFSSLALSSNMGMSTDSLDWLDFAAGQGSDPSYIVPLSSSSDDEFTTDPDFELEEEQVQVGQVQVEQPPRPPNCYLVFRTAILQRMNAGEDVPGLQRAIEVLGGSSRRQADFSKVSALLWRWADPGTVAWCREEARILKAEVRDCASAICFGT